MVNHLPESLAEALRIRAGRGVIPYGGGTDLMIEAAPDAEYLFLHKIPEMRQILRDEKYLRIGAACTFTEVSDNALCPAILREAISRIAAPAIRNLGTVGGNIANGSPKADSALIFFVAGSKLRLMSVRGERIIPVKDFYLGRKRLDLAPDELLTEILMPAVLPRRHYYKKVGARQALAISRVSFAGLFDESGGIIENCAVAFGAVSDVIIRREDIDAMLTGKTRAQARALKPDYLDAYREAIVPIRGRVSEEYRKNVCLNLLEDFLGVMGV